MSAPQDGRPYVQMADGVVAMMEGGEVYVVTDTATGITEPPPIRRAVMVARLRALADVLEGATSDE